MKKFCRVMLLASVLVLASCATATQRASTDHSNIAALETKIHAAKSSQIESVRVYVKAAADSLSLITPVLQNSNDKLSLSLDNQALKVIGNPTAGDQLDVTKLLTQNQGEELRLQTLEQKNATDTVALKNYQDQLSKLQTDLAAANKQVTLEAQQLEVEQHKTLITHIWEWSIGSFGLLGGIAFLIFCPMIAVPILGVIFNFIVTNIPTFFSFVSAIFAGIIAYIAGLISSFSKSAAVTPTKSTTSVVTLFSSSSSSSLSGA